MASPLITGWGGIGETILAVYGIVPAYRGSGRPSPRPEPGKDWRYLQMVKQRDVQVSLQEVQLRDAWVQKEKLIELLEKSTTYIKRSNLATRLSNTPLTRKTLAFPRMLPCIGLQSSGGVSTTTSFVPRKASAFIRLQAGKSNGSCVPWLWLPT